MVYVMDPDGHAVEEAKLGYLVEGPDGAKQKLMTMGMQGAYGANVNFKIIYTEDQILAETKSCLIGSAMR